MVRTSSGVSWVGVVRGQLLTSSSWHARSGRFHAWYREGERPSTRSDHRERQARPRSGDCSQELRLGGAVWDTGLVQADSGEADQREEKPRDRANHLVALPRPQNLGLEGDRLFGDDVTDRKSNAFAKHDRLIASIDTLKRPARIKRLAHAREHVEHQSPRGAVPLDVDIERRLG
jgi:hypothetical protein